MRLTALLILGAAAVAALLLWQTGALAEFAAWARAEQRDLQNALARAVRAARAGEAGVVGGLISAALLYGVVHAAGPGHGKVLIGGAAAASRRTALRMAGIGLVASLGQAVTAILLVAGAMTLLEAGARWAVGTAEDVLAPASYAAIGAVGLLLVWRGLRGLRAQARLSGAGASRGHHADGHAGHGHEGHGHGHGHAGHTHGHGHAHGAAEGDACCGHKHAPSIQEVTGLRGWRDTLLLVGAIAMRPCTGAIIVLVVAWKAGLFPLGMAAATAMALGTGAVVAAVALGAVWLRDAAFVGAGAGRVALVAPALQVAAGGLVAVLSAGLLFA